MGEGKCRKYGCTHFDMDWKQGCANIANWAAVKAKEIKNGTDKDESAALKKCSCGHHYNYHN